MGCGGDIGTFIFFSSFWEFPVNMSITGPFIESFEVWWEELRRICESRSPGYSLDVKDQDVWKEYYDEGFSPTEAYVEDTRD